MKNTPYPFSKDQQAEIREALKKYFLTELEIEISDLQADLMIRFLDEKVGRYYYNLGVMDTMTAVKEQAENLVLLIKE